MPSLLKVVVLLLPLWKEVTALYPSIYEPYESGCHEAGCQPLKTNTAYVDATIGEALRISKLVVRCRWCRVIYPAQTLAHSHVVSY